MKLMHKSVLQLAMVLVALTAAAEQGAAQSFESENGGSSC